MKKAFTFLFCLLFFFLLCGCSFKEAVSAEASEYIVSAIGFDEQNGQIKMLIEALMINSEDADAEKRLEVITGSGSTVKEALQDAYKKTAQPLMLSHLGVIAIGQTVSSDRFNEICNFCYETDEITLSALFITTGNCEKLFSCEPISSVAVGYDIMSMQSEQTDRTGSEFKNRFFEVEAIKEKPVSVLALPFFEVEEEKFFFNGITILNEGKKAMRLSAEQSSIYAIATNTQGAGNIFADVEYKIKSAYSKFTFKNGIENPTLYIELRLAGEKDLKEIKNQIESLFIKSKMAKTDIFGIGNMLYNKNPEDFEKIKENYYQAYQNFQLSVDINEK